MSFELSLWIGFFVVVGMMLILDLGVFHRTSHEVKTKEALAWTFAWIFLALAFNAVILITHGYDTALKFFTGYLIEKSLSVDNIFVFSVVFSYFHVPKIYLHRVLFWGILSALIMRAIMIWLGVILIHRFSWIMYVFGLMLIFTAIKLIFEKREGEHLDQKLIVRAAKKILPLTPDFVGQRFFVWQNGLKATPLFLVLLVLEVTDLIFAVDSIPAIFAITEEPFIIYTSNIFAILGLRSMYFVLANVLDKIYYLRFGLAAILAFVGIKMMIAEVYKIPIFASLGVIIFILTVSIVLSLCFGPKQVEKQS